MSNISFKKNQNLIASNISSMNLSGDGHIYGSLYVEDVRINDTLISNTVVGTDHITTPQMIIDEDNGININMNGHKIINVGEPTDDNDVTTKKFVEDTISSNSSNSLSNPLNSDLDLNTNNILNINNIDGIQYGQTIKQRLGIDNTILEFNNKLCIEGNTVTPTDINRHIDGTSLPNDELIIEGSVKMNSKQYNLNVGGTVEVTGDINASNVSSTNTVSTTIINSEIHNNTNSPTYINIGPIQAGQQYAIAEIIDPAIAEGDITVHIRCLEPGKKQEIVFNCIALPETATITIISHSHETRFLPLSVDSISYGKSLGSNIHYLTFFCGNVISSNSLVEVIIYQNQTDRGTLPQYGMGFTPVMTPIPNLIIQTFLTTFKFTNMDQIGSTGNMLIKGDIETVNTLRTSSIDSSSNNINMNNCNITNINDISSNILKTNSIDTTSGNFISLNSNNVSQIGDIIMNNSNIVGASDIHSVSLTHPNGGTILVNNPIDVGSNKITTSSVATTDNDVVNKLFLSNNTYFDKNGSNIYSKNVVNNIGLGVVNPNYKLDINGDTRVTGDTIVTRDSRQNSSTTDGVTYVTNDSINSEGLTNFRVFPSSRDEFVYKRVSAFNKTFTVDNQTFDVTIPDCLFYPNDSQYSKGVGMVKICYSSMGFTSQGATLLGGIHYKELIVIVRHKSVGIQGMVTTQIHENVHNQTGGNTEYVSVSTRYKILDGTYTGEINTNNLIVGADAAVGVRFTSQNLSSLAYKSILKGTIEAI